MVYDAKLSSFNGTKMKPITRFRMKAEYSHNETKRNIAPLAIENSVELFAMETDHQFDRTNMGHLPASREYSTARKTKYQSDISPQHLVKALLFNLKRIAIAILQIVSDATSRKRRISQSYSLFESPLELRKRAIEQDEFDYGYVPHSCGLHF